MVKFNSDKNQSPPPRRRKRLSKEKILERIYLKYGAFIHELVLNYLDLPEIDTVDVAKAAGVSKQSVHNWLIRVHGTTKKKRLKRSCKSKIRPWQLVPELEQFEIESVKGSDNLYRLLNNNRKIFISRFSWINKPNNCKYAKTTFSQTAKPDLMIMLIGDDKYIFPPPTMRSKQGFTISHKKLQPYKNRFEYLTKPLEEIPQITVAGGKSKYRGVKIEGKRYYAGITISGEYILIGIYSTPVEAARAYDKATLYFCPENLKTNGLETEPFDEVELSRMIRKENQ